METAQAATLAGPSSDTPTLGAFDEDSASRHFAITASQVPKPTGSAMTPAQSPTTTEAKDVKSVGTRFYEECHESDVQSPRLRSSRLYKGKDKENLREESQKKPLRLLDLPVDILKDIVKEVTHTNDLTSLALCHSALHRLTIPHIYSRFDIVWPESNTHAEPRSGVDALTYGLATLCMAEEVFGEAPHQRISQGNRYAPSGKGVATPMMIRRRRGNHYAQFTRKFSLGNGPADWVQEYLITKEGGKMLGTLVALAVARMRSLETFIWDMPTGILRDVWLALSSLGDREDNRACRLEKVWVRWHDNNSSETTNPIPPPPPPMNMSVAHPAPLHYHSGSTPVSSIPPQIHSSVLDRVENPSFSTLPPLKSLSVLDIDELAYLDEMAVLIGRSLDKLRELRIGIARHALQRDWVTIWEGEGLQQVDPVYPTHGSLTIGEKRLGGVLGTLTGFVCDMRKPRVPLPDRSKRRSMLNASPTKSPAVAAQSTSPRTSMDREPIPEASGALSGITSLRDVLPDVIGHETPSEVALMTPATSSWAADAAYENDPLVAQSSHHSSPMRSPLFHAQQTALPPTPEIERPSFLEPAVPEPEPQPEKHWLENTLSLESLELERVPLSISVLQKAIDWTRLTSLTLLHCQNHEQLWKTLRRTFAPVPKSPTYPHPRRTPNTSPRKGGRVSITGSDIELSYPLGLKKVHTNTVSPALISFLKETLAPNSLEVLFLQEARSYPSSVSVDQIFKGPLRRHRSSLKKVLIDSSEKGQDGLPSNNSRWRRWMVTREILAFITSGKMPNLRELGCAIDYRDWVSYPPHHPPSSSFTNADDCVALLPPTPPLNPPPPLPQHPLPGRPRPRHQRRSPRARAPNRGYCCPTPGCRDLLHGYRE